MAALASRPFLPDFHGVAEEFQNGDLAVLSRQDVSQVLGQVSGQPSIFVEMEAAQQGAVLEADTTGNRHFPDSVTLKTHKIALNPL